MVTIEDSRAFIETFERDPYQKGDLDGLTFAVKDCIDVAGSVTGCGNVFWKETHKPAVVNAICVDQLLSHGAKCIGKVATDEFTFGLEGENPHYGTPLNPRAPDRVPGGSSSGSASAVACGLVDFSIGTDSGGSIRIPASNCGVFGFRPSFGAIPTAGVMPLSPSYDTVGVIARNYDILNRAASVLLCSDTPLDVEIDHIYLIKEVLELTEKPILQAFESSIEKLKLNYPNKIKQVSLHNLVEEFSPLPLHQWLEIFTFTQSPEVWSTQGSFIKEIYEKLGNRVKSNYDFVKIVDRTHVGKYFARREWYFELMSTFLKPGDLLCFPTTPMFAPLKDSLDDNQYADKYYSKVLSITSIAGICRLPEITVPMKEVEGVPIGLSFAAAHRQDAFLLWAVSQFLQ
jgi:amidase